MGVVVDMVTNALIKTINDAYDFRCTYEQPVFSTYKMSYSPRTCMRNALCVLAQFVVNTCVDLIRIMDLLRLLRYLDNAVCSECLMVGRSIQSLLKYLMCGIQSMGMLYDNNDYFTNNCPDACVSTFLIDHLQRMSSKRMTVPQGVEPFRTIIGDFSEEMRKQAALLCEFVRETHLHTVSGFMRGKLIANLYGAMRIGRFTIGPTGGGHAQLVLMQKAALATQSHALRQEDAPPAYSAVYPLPGDA